MTSKSITDKVQGRTVIRDLKIDDIPAIKKIHEESGIDYQFPNLESPLFVVTKVFEADGIIRAAGGLYIQVEAYLWLDKSEWAEPGKKLDTVRRLNDACMDGAWLKGIDCCVLYLPPGFERFGERLVHLGFQPNRDGWVTYSRRTKDEN